MILAAAVDQGRQILVTAGMAPADAGRDAVLLARAVLGWDAASWLTRSREDASSEFSERFTALLERRARHEPIAYILGSREFYGRTFQVNRHVLIPRPETEAVIEEALQCLAALSPRSADDGHGIVDIGTGSGCLAVTLALEWPRATVTATDISAEALDVARENARRLGVSERIDFLHGAFFAGLPGPVDVVVSNPPYVRETDRLSLPRDVADFEPGRALFSGADGLDAIRELLAAAPDILSAGGWLVMEIGQGQIDDVRRLVGRTPGLALRRVRPDLQAIPRVVVAQRMD